jgi:hypothetical protein
VTSLAVAVRRRWIAIDAESSVLLFALGLTGGVAALIVVSSPLLYRPLFAITLATVLLLIGMRWPRAALALTLTLFLPTLALTRRLLIPAAGWTSYDPLVLVAPAVVFTVLLRLLVAEHRRPLQDTLTRLVLFLLALGTIQLANPLGAGLVANLAGYVFFAGPLLWFLAGQQVADVAFVRSVLLLAVANGALVSIYGLWQTEIGLPRWDAVWVDLAGYEALDVGGVTRAFGSFASSAEYATYLGSSLAVATVFAIHRHTYLLVLAPVIAFALLLASARGALVLTALAVIVGLALNARTVTRAIALVVVGIVLASAAGTAIEGPLDQVARRSGNALVQHQLGGLANPLDPGQSTLMLHLELFALGVERGVANPLGYGVGVTGPAEGLVGHSRPGFGSEVDISNAFVSLGVLGGLTYTGIVALVLTRLAWLGIRARNPEYLAAMAVLVVNLGQWANGGHYALAPLCWFLIGWTTREWVLSQGAPKPIGSLAGT